MNMAAAGPSSADIDLKAVDIEQSALAAILRDNTALPEIAALISAADFYDPLHGRIFARMVELSADNRPILPQTLRAVMADDPGLCDLEGDYLRNLALGADSARSNVREYARVIREMSQRRTGLAACRESQDALGRLDIPVLTALRPVSAATETIITADGRGRFMALADAITDVLDKAEDAANGKKPVTICTGIDRLDDVLGGLHPGDLSIVAGRPGMGKSSLLLTIALANVMRLRPAIVFSLEMTASQLLHRIGCDLDFDTNAANPLSYSWFRSSPGHADVARLRTALVSIPAGLLEIRDCSGMTASEIAATAQAFAARHSGLGVVLVDYLQRVDPGDRYRGSKVQEVTEISNALKALALRLRWPVVAGAQLSRGVEGRDDKRPMLSDLRESGAIEQDADSVIGMYRPGYYVTKRKPSPTDPKYGSWLIEDEETKHRLDLVVLKNRHGREDALSVYCDMRASAIRDRDPAEAA